MKIDDLMISIRVTDEQAGRYRRFGEQLKQADSLFGTLPGTFARVVREASEAEERSYRDRMLDQPFEREAEKSISYGRSVSLRPSRRVSSIEASLMIEAFDRKHPELRAMLDKITESR